MRAGGRFSEIEQSLAWASLRRDDVLRIGLSIYHDEPDLEAFCAACGSLS
jgi:selenocysteine lyase/cysteine desulfurase